MIIEVIFMKKGIKLTFIVMLVMLICAVSTVSATDINETDNVSDNIVIDEVTDVVEDVEIDDVSQDIVEENADDASDSVAGGNLRSGTIITNETYSQYFDENGYLNDSSVHILTFQGNFNEVSPTFGNFKINRFVSLDVTDAVFTNIGFDLMDPSLNLVGANFIANENATNYAPIRVLADGVVVDYVNITVNAPEGRDYFAIDVANASNVRLLNNIITYNCGYDNPVNYNYAIRAKNSTNINIIGNTINATLPLKTVNWNLSGSIDADYVAAVAIENSNTTRFIGNTLNVVGDRRVGSYPTLDAFIIANSSWAHVEDNIIHENDIVTGDGSYSYIYGIDVYSCESIRINNNEITMNGNESGWATCGNGTGAAYGVQLSGKHDDVTVSWNNITTTNRGSNLAIYSQNYNNIANKNLKIYRNIVNVTGKAGIDSWDLLSGIEIQDKSAEIYENIVLVNNTVPYNKDNRAFGISYSQWINGTHSYNIHNNYVEVFNGTYAVYLLDSVNMTQSYVMYNSLRTYARLGNDAVFCGIWGVFVEFNSG